MGGWHWGVSFDFFDDDVVVVVVVVVNVVVAAAPVAPEHLIETTRSQESGWRVFRKKETLHFG